jgi:hypothetical protein
VGVAASTAAAAEESAAAAANGRCHTTRQGAIVPHLFEFGSIGARRLPRGIGGSVCISRSHSGCDISLIKGEKDGIREAAMSH